MNIEMHGSGGVNNALILKAVKEGRLDEMTFFLANIFGIQKPEL
jgi:hypothetical protein